MNLKRTPVLFFRFIVQYLILDYWLFTILNFTTDFLQNLSFKPYCSQGRAGSQSDTAHLPKSARSIMDFITQISPLIENIGFPALVFAIWYIYHQSQVKAFETIIQDNLPFDVSCQK